MTTDRLQLWKDLNSELAVASEKLLTIYQTVRKDILNEEPDKYISFTGADEYSISYGGDEYWSYGGYERHHLELPTTLLEEEIFEIENYFKREANLVLEYKLKEKQKTEESKKQQDLQKLAELKEKYEKSSS